MKVFAVNGSARKDGNTALLIREVFTALEAVGIGTELFQFAGKHVRGCTACGSCFKNKDRRCILKGDVINDIIQKMDEADGVILASPTYFSNVTTELKALIDRAGYVAMANDYMFKRKVGAAVVAVRRAGAIHAFNSINHFFTIGQMIIPGSSYWNIGIGRQIGDVSEDEEGLRTMRQLGENMAWLLKKIKADK
jgi:multimeric flavodoxin WrbA